MSIRRACSVLNAERSSYNCKMPGHPRTVQSRGIKDLAETRCAMAIGALYQRPRFLTDGIPPRQFC